MNDNGSKRPSPLNRAVRGLIRLYQITLSPLIHAILGPGAGCRFTPSCSEYARLALQNHGFLRATWLSAWRILRCNPFSKGGYDPPPPARNERRRKDGSGRRDER